MKYKDNPEKLLDSEKYMEIQGFDVRLAVQKMNDFLDTLGDATIALTYANKDEYEDSSRNILFVRRIHIRHAIIDFNNCFDLLLQIPWFYYRGWQEFNPNGRLYSNNNYTEVVRNNDGWIEIAEQNCSYNRVKRVLGLHSEQNIVDFKNKLISFCDKYIYNKTNSIVIRDIANKIKHNHGLKIQELYVPHNLDIDLNGQKINLKDSKLGAKFNFEFYDEKTRNVVGDIELNYIDDLEVNIKYKGGETFRGKDILREDISYSIEDLYKELVKFRDDILELYYNWYELAKSNIELNPFFKNNTIKKGTDFNLDKFFKTTSN
ncbi:hypothetical protein [Peribacillus asahii]|uniref:hypothetical protein n=1 Tax=Peribacillus asahii TaxID=228899 RepID=UPI0037FB95D6